MTKTREQRIQNGTLIPNSFQHPNLYIDWLSYYLTAEEEKVLNKAVREILGWEDKIADRRAKIALSIFCDGKTDRNGEPLCLGCGLGLQAIRKALASLDQYGILTKDGPPTQDGQSFRLQDDANKIDWNGLATRREEWDMKNVSRTKAATEASLESRGLTSDVGGNVARYPNPLGVTSDVTPGVPCDVMPGVTSDVRPGVTSDVNKETQIETQKESQLEKDPFTDLWSQALDELRLTMTKATFDTHLQGSALVPGDNGAWVLQAYHSLSVGWLQHRLGPRIIETLARISGEERELEVISR